MYHVVTYIKHELDLDDLSFSNPLYASMLNEFHAAFVAGQSASAQQFFLRNSNLEMIQVATDVLSDRYQLSRMFDKNCSTNKVKAKKLDNEEGDRLPVDVPRVVFNYKFNWVETEMKKCMAQMQQTEDETERNEIFKRYHSLHMSKEQLAKFLGERIII